MDGPTIGLFCVFGCVTLFLVIRIVELQRRVDSIANQLGLDPPKTGELSERVKELARDPALKIQAIKAYREESGSGLADAKDAVEAYIRGQNS